MSLLNALFGGGKKPAAAAPTRVNPNALADNQKTCDMLEKKIEHTEKTKIKPLQMKAVALAKKGTAKSKSDARQLLKQTKPYVTSVNNMRGQLHNLQSVRIALESKNHTQEVLRVMESNVAELQNGFDMDKADEVIGDMEEQIGRAAEISSALGTAIDTGEYVDDDELDAELAELMDEEDPDLAGMEDDPISFPAVPSSDSADLIGAPSVPTTAVPAAPAAEQSQLDDLLAFAE